MIPDAEVARVCHEANRAFCETLGDYSQVLWIEASAEIQHSALTGVRFRRDNPTAPVSRQHDSWTATKLAQGWVWGQKKDPVAKTHPCLVPYDLLPVEQRVKDDLFVAIVRALS